jgi:DNA-binding MarR family transcriptional regulator
VTDIDSLHLKEEKMKEKFNDELLQERDYKLWVLLEQVRTGIVVARDKELAEFGISTIMGGVLAIVNAIGNEATPAQISRWIMRRAHSVSGLVERMAQKGLIRKSKDLHKKNLVRVTITDKGQKAFKQSLKRKSIHQIMSALTEKEKDELFELLDKLRSKSVKVAKISFKPPFPDVGKSK